jgi:sigma-E factor negative regulatory protein RseA
MRGEEPQKEWNIADSVALALENEAPHSLFTKQNEPSLSQVVPIESQPEPQQARKRLPTWLAHLGQVSIAASVCFAVVLGVQQSGNQDSKAIDNAIPVLQTVPLAGVAEPVSLTRESVEKQASEINVPEQRRKINALLQDYELQLRLNSNTNINVPSHQEPVVE